MLPEHQDADASSASDPAFGERLKNAREQRGFSQGEVARALGVSRPAYGQWETGAVTPGLAKIRRLSEILGATPEHLALGISATRGADEDVCWIDCLSEASGGASPWPLPRTYLDAANLAPEHLRIWQVEDGWSRYDWRSGDVLLVNTSVSTVTSPGAYLLRQGTRLLPAPLARVPTRTRVDEIMMNVSGGQVRVSEADLDIVGRIVRAWSSI